MKKKVLIALSVLILILVAAILSLNFVVYPRIVKRIRGVVKESIQHVAAKTGRNVRADEIIVSQKGLTIKNLRIMDKHAEYALFSVKTIRLHFNLFQILRNQPVGPLIIRGALLHIHLNKHKADDLIDLVKAFNKGRRLAKATGKHKKHLVNKRIQRIRLSKLLLDNLAIEIKDEKSPNHVINLGHITGSLDNPSHGMSGQLNGYLWISQGGITKVHMKIRNRILSVGLASRINLPAWLFPGAENLSFNTLMLSINKGISLSIIDAAIRIKSSSISNDNLSKKSIQSKMRQRIKTVVLHAQEIGLGTRIIPLYPLKLWVKKLNVHGYIMIHGKKIKFTLTDARADTTLTDQGYNVRVSGRLALQNRHKGPVHIALSGDPVSWFRQVILDLKGPVVPSGLAVFDRRLIVLPESSGMVHIEIADTMDKGWNFNGRGQLQNIGYFSTRVCLSPVFGINAKTTFDGVLTSDRRHLMLNADSLTLNGIKMSGAFIYNRFGDAPARMKLDIDLPKQGCGKIVDAIPKVMRPQLPDMRAKGSMSAHASISTDLKDIFNRTKFDANVNIDNCQVITLGSIVGLKMLDTSFVLKRPDPKNKGKSVLIGPGTDNYVPLGNIPIWTQQAALATEDMAFFTHQGFKPGLIRRAIALNLKNGWYVYGGSTITQQLVKNLFLSTEKSLSRKLEEAIITWQMEKHLTKEKILELYLNCIEYGIGVYGIKQAAKVYFNKTPDRLTPLESAWIMATKPSPKYAFRVYKRGKFNKWWVNRMRNILLRLWKEMHVIDELSFLHAAPYLPAFYYEDRGVYLKPGIRGKFKMPQSFPKELPDLDIEHELLGDIRGLAPPIINIRRIESWW